MLSGKSWFGPIICYKSPDRLSCKKNKLSQRLLCQGHTCTCGTKRPYSPWFECLTVGHIIRSIHVPAHLCAITCQTEILSAVMICKQIRSGNEIHPKSYTPLLILDTMYMYLREVALKYFTNIFLLMLRFWISNQHGINTTIYHYNFHVLLYLKQHSRYLLWTWNLLVFYPCKYLEKLWFLV